MDGKSIFDRPSGASSGRSRERTVAACRGSAVRCEPELRGEAGGSGVSDGLDGACAAGPPRWSGKLAPYLMALLEWVEAEPDITMPELAAKLQAEKAVTAHPASLSRALLRAGLSFKKNTAGHGGRARGRASGA